MSVHLDPYLFLFAVYCAFVGLNILSFLVVWFIASRIDAPVHKGAQLFFILVPPMFYAFAGFGSGFVAGSMAITAGRQQPTFLEHWIPIAIFSLSTTLFLMVFQIVVGLILKSAME